MADLGDEGAHRHSEDSDECLNAEPTFYSLSDNRLGADPAVNPDHCDLLLDAIDAHLSQLQVPTHTCHSRGHTPERSTDSCEEVVPHEDTEQTLNHRTRAQDEMASQREHVIWRLERLLGEACREGRIARELRSPSESICTEDFDRRFREEMVEVQFPEGSEEEAEKIESPHSATYQSGQNGESDAEGKRTGTEIIMRIHEGEVEKIIHDVQKAETEKAKHEGRGDGSIFHRAEVLTEHENPPNTSPKDSCLSAVKRSIYADRNHPHRKAQHNRRHASRRVCSFGDDDDTDEDGQWSMRPERTSRGRTEEMQSEWEESCLHEVRDKELLAVCQRTMSTKDETCTKTVDVMSMLEREEMERQLDRAKTELFAEQRRGREKLECMQDKLEETCEELQRVTEAENSLRNRCSCLEDKLRQKKEQTKTLQFEVSELQGKLGQCKVKVEMLEKTLAQKELQFLDLEKHHSALQAENDGLKEDLENLKMQHLSALREAQEQAHQTMEATLKKQNKELTMAHKQEIQKAEEEKASVLKEQASSLTRLIEFLQSCTQPQDEQANQLMKYLKEQKGSPVTREDELLVEALEKMHKGIKEERRKWEVEKVEAVQVHCGILEEQNKRNMVKMRSAMLREKKAAVALQHTVTTLQTKVQELQAERTVQLKQRESLLGVCKSLKEEHKAKLQTSQLQLEQLVRHLCLELETEKQSAEQLSNDKERELCIQRQQLRKERDQALHSLKERVIQEHIEELSSLQAEMCDGGEDVAECLAKQLRSKQQELRRVQSSRAQRKERIDAQLERKSEEELPAQLDRQTPKAQKGSPRDFDPPVRERRLKAKETRDSVSFLPPCRPSDVASLKLVRYLQSRVKELRAENQAYAWIWSPLNPVALELTEASHKAHIGTSVEDPSGYHPGPRAIPCCRGCGEERHQHMLPDLT